jgi:DNA-binding transcriptional LysR family regulator
MTAAANELAVTPGAISKQVKQLEEFLGTPLFAGTKYHPVLTPAGAALLPVLSEAFAQIKTGIRAIQVAGSQVVTVSCLNTFAMRWLIPRLYQFNALHPTIDVRLSTTAQDGAESMNHDVVITVVTATANQTNVPNTSNVQLLFEEKIGPVLSPALAQRYTLHNPSDLRGKPILQTRTRHEAWKL